MINKDTLKINQRKHHGSGSRSCDNLQSHSKLSLFCLSSKPSKWFIFKEFSTLQQQENKFNDVNKIKVFLKRHCQPRLTQSETSIDLVSRRSCQKENPLHHLITFFYGILQPLPGLTEIPMTFQFSFKGTSGGDGMVKS